MVVIPTNTASACRRAACRGRGTGRAILILGDSVGFDPRSRPETSRAAARTLPDLRIYSSVIGCATRDYRNVVDACARPSGGPRGRAPLLLERRDAASAQNIDRYLKDGRGRRAQLDGDPAQLPL
jgi:hypothetical protein